MKIPNNYSKILPLMTLLVSLSVFSAEMCVGNRDELNQALYLASFNDQDDEIRISQGTYVVATTGFFEDGFQYFGADEDFDLEISGGWLGLNSAPCAIQFNNPFLTKLDGDELRRVLYIETGEADVTISNLRIMGGHFVTSELFTSGGGLKVRLRRTSTAKIERVIFTSNYAVQAGALIVEGNYGTSRVYLKNNLFAYNTTDSKSNAFAVLLFNSENYIINNTVMFNTGSGIRTYLSPEFEYKAFFANNIFWGNDVYDYFITDGGETSELYLYNNNLGIQQGNLPVNTIQSGNISQDPQLELGIFNFTPASGSPMINAGRSAPINAPVPPRFQFSWQYGLLDLLGDDRVQNGHVDIGAFEAPPPDLIFADGFE